MYGTIPIAASFAARGMREDWLAAFMMSSVLLNPQLLLYSAVLGTPILLVRLLSCLLCGMAAGYLVYRFYTSKGRRFFRFDGFGEPANRDTDPDRLRRFLKNLGRNVRATGGYFLLGIVLAALFQRYVPAEPSRCFSAGRMRASAFSWPRPSVCRSMCAAAGPSRSFRRGS